MKKALDLQSPPLPEKFSRVVIDRLSPEIDGGRFAAKAFIDQAISIKAIFIVDGHDKAKGRLLYRHESETEFHQVPFIALGNDEWLATFQAPQLGLYYFCAEAAMDRLQTWSADVIKKIQADQDIKVDLAAGGELLQEALNALAEADKSSLQKVMTTLKTWADGKKNFSASELKDLLSEKIFLVLNEKYFEAKSLVRFSRELPLQVEPAIARFSSWYEFFPRSTVDGSAHHGTLREAAERLDYAKEMGFNIVYLPPIHPIGTSFRKGKNNTLQVTADDVGSPWAIGAKAGGHKDILPELGTFKDFDLLIQKARSLKIEIALDMAFQCSPDHPYVKEHPQWFKKRADGTIQYAENPPKKYQDIYPFDFESEDWRALWEELRSVIQFWADKGVRVFRVDNPHTKPFHFWEWLISSIKKKNPEVIFLAEAFTRPHVMAYLAKAGFSQSYTYFTWRREKWDLTKYMTELTQTEMVDFFSPNFWPNTPDILPEDLQTSDRATYMLRLILAATLSSNFGIYGPAFELMESQPTKPGGEEYLNSEKYQLRQWNLAKPESLSSFIRRVNEIRQSCKALQQNRTWRSHPTTNENLFAFSKTAGDEKILVVVNLTPQNIQSGQVELPLVDWKIDPQSHFEVHDLLTDAHYFWSGWHNYVELGPMTPAHIFRVITKAPAFPG